MSFVDASPSPRPPVRPRHSLQSRLRARELGLHRTVSPVIKARRFYQCIYPNETVFGVDTQNSILKRFTPCGQYLIAISKDLVSVHIFRFKGSSIDAETPHGGPLGFRDYFQLLHDVHIPRDTEVLSKDFCLVTANQRFMIVASISPGTRRSSDARSYPCSLNCIPKLDTFAFYVIEIETGKIVDRKQFKNEYINIAHHAGVSLYGSLLSVMLIQSQAIQIIHIKDCGKMIELQRVGWYNHGDDELVLAKYQNFNEQFIAQQNAKSSVPYPNKGLDIKGEFNYQDLTGSGLGLERLDSAALAPSISLLADTALENQHHQVPSVTNPGQSRPTQVFNPTPVNQPNFSRIHCEETTSNSISGIKQRLLAYMFRKAFYANDHGAALRQFHLTFPQFANLVMWRTQFLDEAHILIKFGKLDCVISRQSDNSHQTAFYVVYSLQSTEIISVYDNASEEFMNVFESWADQFCAIAYSTSGNGRRHYSSTCSNNIFAKDLMKKHQYGMRHARNGGASYAIKRSLCVLPYTPQSMSDSPYFDLALFSYDEKVISPSDRQRQCQDFPIKFYLRGTGELKFRMHLFRQGATGGPLAGANGSVNGAVVGGGPGGGTAGGNISGGGGGGGGMGANMSRSRRYATFIAHPFEPFIISSVHNQVLPTVTNFHVRIAEPFYSTSPSAAVSSPVVSNDVALPLSTPASLSFGLPLTPLPSSPSLTASSRLFGGGGGTGGDIHMTRSRSVSSSASSSPAVATFSPSTSSGAWSLSLASAIPATPTGAATLMALPRVGGRTSSPLSLSPVITSAQSLISTSSSLSSSSSTTSSSSSSSSSLSSTTASSALSAFLFSQTQENEEDETNNVDEAQALDETMSSSSPPSSVSSPFVSHSPLPPPQ